MRKTLLLAAALALLAAPAAAAPAAATTCVRHDDILNWTSLSDKYLVLENYRHQKVLLKLIGSCSGFKFHDTIAIKSQGGFGLSCVSPGDIVITRDMGTGGRCAVVSVKPYVPGMEKTLLPEKNADDHGGDRHSY